MNVGGVDDRESDVLPDEVWLRTTNRAAGPPSSTHTRLLGAGLDHVLSSPSTSQLGHNVLHIKHPLRDDVLSAPESAQWAGSAARLHAYYWGAGS